MWLGCDEKGTWHPFSPDCECNWHEVENVHLGALARDGEAVTERSVDTRFGPDPRLPPGKATLDKVRQNLCENGRVLLIVERDELLALLPVDDDAQTLPADDSDETD